jgi:small subunit ribosomal protein S6
MSIRRVYETTTIINAALEDTDVEVVINKITSFLTTHGGEVEEVHKWGRRRLAYPINKKHNGFYVHFIFNIQPSEVPLLERFLTLDDTVIRHLTLLLEPDLREYRKEKSLAEGKAGETIISSVVEVEKIATVFGDKSAVIITGDGETITEEAIIEVDDIDIEEPID